MIKIYITLFLLFSCFLNAQDLHEEVTKVFNFYPHKLSKEEQQKLMPSLDKFFEFVINNKEKYLVPLRNELRRNDNLPYFYFDGGILLLEISKTPEDYQIVADALTKCYIKDIPNEMYLNYLLDLSKKGANVIDAALNILDDTTFSAFIPQHVLTLQYAEGLFFILPRYNPDLYLDKLITRYEKIQSVEAKLYILDLFACAASCKADSYLEAQKLSKKQDRRIKITIEKLLKMTDVKRQSNDLKYKELFEERAKSTLTRISDEALGEFRMLTNEMKKNYICK